MPQAHAHRRWTLVGSVIAVVVLGLGISALVSELLAWLAFGWLPWDLHPVSPKTATFLDPVKVALTVAAGVGGAVALVVAYRKQSLAERGEPRQQYSEAAEQLGHTSPTVQLAGVYALANLADEKPRLAQQCVDVICGHLRLPWTVDDVGEREVRNTMLRVIAERTRGEGPWSMCRIDLTNAQLPSVNLEGSVFKQQLLASGAVVRGSSNFSAARFDGGADFAGATFEGVVSFSYARLASKSDFSEAIFGDDARFTGCLLKLASFRSCEFRGNTFLMIARFNGEVTFRGAQFTKILSLDGAKFAFCEPEVFGGANFLGPPATFNVAEFGPCRSEIETTGEAKGKASAQ